MWKTIAILGIITLIIGIAYLIFMIIKKKSPIIPVIVLCSGAFLFIAGWFVNFMNQPVSDIEISSDNSPDSDEVDVDLEEFIISSATEVTYDELKNAEEKIDGFIYVEGVVSESTGEKMERFILESDEGNYHISNLDLNNEYENGDHVIIYGLHNFESESDLPAVSASVIKKQ